MTAWLTLIPRGGGGLWRFLTERVRARTAIELEHERNRATAAALRDLPDGSELLEYEPHGRLRIIRRLGPSAPPAVRAALPMPRGDAPQ
jgi:hypothetical protein